MRAPGLASFVACQPSKVVSEILEVFPHNSWFWFTAGAGFAHTFGQSPSYRKIVMQCLLGACRLWIYISHCQQVMHQATCIHSNLSAA